MPSEPNKPVMNDYWLKVDLSDGNTCIAEVEAQTLEDACREIVHQQMKANNPVRRIRIHS